MLVSIIPTAFADEIEPDNSVQNNENRVEATEPAPVETLSPDEANEAAEATSEPIETASPSVEAETPEATPAESITASDDDSIGEIDTSIQLMATGTYYPEYGFYFDENSGTITDADEDISGFLNIPETTSGKPVTKISNYAFQDCKSLTGLNIPKAVTNIGNSAFQNCTNLSEVTLNYNNTREFECSIGNYAFSGCTSLKNLIIPDSITYLGEHFIENTAIESITVPKSIKSVGAYYGGPFAECTTLSHITIENGITALPNNLFDGATYITNITIPESVTSIGHSAFLNCTNLKKIDIPKEVKSIGNSAFQNCTNFSEVTLNYNNAREFECSIGNYAFSGCTSLKNLTIPDSITYLGEHFIENTAIESITVPKSIKSVGAYYGGPFAECTTLSHITIENGITALPNNLFDGATYITNITIPESVTSIGHSAFLNCTNLEKIDIPKNVSVINTSAFQACSNLSQVTLHYNNAREFELKIYDYAFNGCSKLTELILPESVTYLGHHFTAGTAISNITIPKSIKSVGEYYGGPFSGNINLTYVTLEDGMTAIPANLLNYYQNPSYVENVTIPSSITDIGARAFEDCDAITAVDIPKGVKSIGQGAFQNCNNLTNVIFHENNEEGFELKIYDTVFQGCSKLSKLNLPDTVTYLGHHMIQGTSISSITVPKSVTGVGANYGGPFAGAVYLDDIIFEDGTTAIFDYECESNSDMSYISRIEIPATVTKIGRGAFKNCTKLKSINIPDSVQTISDEAFYNCPQLNVSISEYAPAIADLIDDDIRFFLSKEITSYNHFTYSNTDYYSKANEMTGYVPFELKYELKDNVSVTNKKIVVRIPNQSTLVESTLKLDGILLQNYTYENNLLTIPVEANKADITFCVKPTEYTTLLTYAKMDFTENNENKSEIIGVINCSIPDISIKADSLTNNGRVTVEGIAPPSSTVDFYIGDEKVGTTTAIKSGNYKTTVDIPSPENYKKYTITAQTEKDGERVDAEGTVVYQEAAPALKSLVMYYGDHTSTHKYELTNNSTAKPTIVFYPSSGFKFEVEFENAENIDKVRIVSTRNNQRKYMPAYWDETAKCYVAQGHFEDTNPSSYVPGEITVEYLQKSEPYLFGDEIDFTSAEYANTLPEAWEGAKVTLTDENGDEMAQIQLTEVSLDSLSGVIDFYNTLKGKLEFNILSEVIPEHINKQNASEYGYERVVDEVGEELYVKVAEEADSKIQSEVIDFAKGKVSSFLIENKYYGADMALDNISSITSVLGDVDKIVTYNNNRVDINNARQNVLNSSWSPEEKQERLHRLDIAEKSNNAELAVLALSTILAVSGIGLPPVCALVLTALSYQNTMEIEYALGDWDNYIDYMSSGVGFLFNWSVDPSGYVYEAVTNNRVEGVAATAYWIAPDYIDENGKGDESKAVLWDASEYAQMNPILTDGMGAYAWDVPEGLWQVKYEKDGYETQYSDWLPVPPPQTNVNIGLVSKAVPKVESAVLTSNTLAITFDKYMKPDTVTNVKISGYTYTMDYSKDETAPDGTVYARTYTFNLNEPVSEGESVPVSISNAESYAGTKMVAYNEDVVCSNSVENEYLARVENVSEDKSNKTVSADIINISDKMQSFDAICAIYDASGRLTGLKTMPIVGLAKEESWRAVFKFDTEWSSYKIFVWDSLNGMKPLSE